MSERGVNRRTLLVTGFSSSSVPTTTHITTKYKCEEGYWLMPLSPVEAVMMYLIPLTVHLFSTTAFLWVGWLGEGRCGTDRGHLEGSSEGWGLRGLSHPQPQWLQGSAGSLVLPSPRRNLGCLQGIGRHKWEAVTVSEFFGFHWFFSEFFSCWLCCVGYGDVCWEDLMLNRECIAICLFFFANGCFYMCVCVALCCVMLLIHICSVK